MPFEELLGTVRKLTVDRLTPPGAFLVQEADAARPNRPALLLPRSEVPEGTREGDQLDVFVYLDSEDRPIATLRAPKVTLGEVAFLTVVDSAPFGAFVDWGLVKQLLVPFAEQTSEMLLGQRYPVGLFVDESGRLAGTMRVAEMLRAKRAFRRDEWVAGEAWRKESELGIFVIVERSAVGLLPASEPHTLTRGQAATFRVSNVLPDGKIELSLRRHAFEELEDDAAKVLRELSRTPPGARVGERSSPEAIRARFGLSKKAFKRAVGRLLKQGVITIDDAGFLSRK